jgi:tight adherence protein C
MFEITPLIVILFAFGCIAILVYLLANFITSQIAQQRRLPIAASTSDSSGISKNVIPSVFLAALDEKKFGIEGPIRAKLRQDLIKAGYFSDSAIRYYILARLTIVVVLPTIVFLLAKILFPDLSYLQTFGIMAFAAFIAVLGPDAYVSRRQRMLQKEYRLVFPDFIDMLVVCTDAGLSLDGALARIEPEVSKESRTLGMNLILLGAETRAGRSTTDALGAFAERLDLDEARSFMIMLRQSLELGTDVSEALRVFSDEMRDKRLLRAEETANKLPVKMVIPLGGLIFPVILMVIMIPVIIRLLFIAGAVGR